MNAKKLLDDITVKADHIGIRLERHASEDYSFRDEKPESAGQHEDLGAMVEVMQNGQLGYAGTSDLSSAGLNRAAERALGFAFQAQAYPNFTFSKNIRTNSQGTFKSPGSVRLSDLNHRDLCDVLQETCKVMKISDKVITTTASANFNEKHSQYVNTRGANIDQEFTYRMTSQSLVASDGGEPQSRSDGGYLSHCFQGGSDLYGRERFLTLGRKLSEEVFELLDAEDCPEDTMDLILAPDQMYMQIHETIGHPIELDRILGDERNYAGWSFVSPKDFGELQYGSGLMNVTFDPTYTGEFASYGFDESGAPAEKEFLIKNGKLVRGLGGRESQERSGLPGVSNFRSSSWNRAPIDRIGNVNIEPGTSSLFDIIESTERGVFMHSNRSWSIDDYRNKFQFGCDYAHIIENGKISKVVKNPNYRGLTTSFWNSLTQVGDRDTLEVFGTPFCGKGEPNQLIRVGHASPVCKFKNIEVFGGGK